MFRKAYIFTESTQDATKQSVIYLNKKTIYIVVAVLVVVIIVGVAGVLLLNNGGNTNTNPTPTPTPTPATTIVGATTVQFSVNDTAAGVSYTFAAKNFNSSTEVVRVDMVLSADSKYSYILDASQEKSWTSTNGGAWSVSDFATDWTTYGTLFNGYVDKITAQTSLADFTDGTNSFYCIAANPTLADSLFATS